MSEAKTVVLPFAGTEERGARLNNIGDIRTFVAVVEHGSFSKAADVLRISQPSVSQRLQNLEQIFGMRLLERRGGVELTATGRDLFNRARLLLSRIDDFEAVAEELRTLKRGRIAVGYSSPAIAMTCAARFMSLYPGVGVHFSIGNTRTLGEALHALKIDVAILTLETPPEGLHCQLVAEQQLILCGRRNTPFARAGRVRPADLADLTLILREEGSMTRELFERAVRASGIPLGPTIEVPSREAVKEAAAAGLGYGIVLDNELGRDARLAPIEIDGIDARGGTYAAVLPGSVDVPYVKAFLETCGG